MLVARRAGYRCSIPSCRRLTIGPGAGLSDVAEIGVASHIYAASAEGPRGTGGLSFEQRRSLDNAVWLCADHARLVDANAGNRYPASLLRSWKGLHEELNRLELGGYPRPFGWIESLKVSDSSTLLTSRQFYFGARNLIVGGNATGKTVLTWTIAGIGRPDYLAEAARSARLVGTVRWYDPIPHELTFAATDGRVSHELDGRSVPYVAKPYRTILVNGADIDRFHDLNDLAQALDSNPTAMANVLTELPGQIVGHVAGVEIENNSVKVRFHRRSNIRPEVGDLSRMPHVAQTFLLVELAVAYAQVQAEVEPTLLVLDEVFPMLELEDAQHMYSFLTERAHRFQVVIATALELPREFRSSWLVTRFRR